MKIITTEKAKAIEQNKKMLKRYWSTIYPVKEFVEPLVGKVDKTKEKCTKAK